MKNANIESENPNNFSSGDEEFLSFQDVSKLFDDGYLPDEILEAKPELAVVRIGTNDYGLWGYICKQEGNDYRPFGYTLEPTRNIPEKGFIPAGSYKFKRWDSAKLKKTLRLYSVPNFTNVLVHVGNYKKDTLGCILAAKSVDNPKKPKMLTESRVMTDHLYDAYPNGRIVVAWL